ncbi:GNAT family N-acetyltransferase [Bradyrhizobium sp. AUGA SZCCT0176]|uniref:acyl-homoserine-lactone synthase n=1 Tax=Bradyrhizobium sp. AUGA SZCCT0176 TaxID=2807664 RepID=UPI001BA7E082|nr:acyl-homoserine-lactone synthase [Bradyrhizobium sp. AUGA SZCCT0176]MBR1225109.1 GNAT family N-acetyltransferase [Bradyrhizobium sp. AUGA SZCCT0176]
MIEVISKCNRQMCTSSLISFFELRYRVFSQRLGWPARNNGLPIGIEVDEFDRADTVYMVVRDIKGNVIAGLRLLETTGQYLLGSHFSSFVDGPSPCDSKVVEVSRLVLDPCRDRQVSGSGVVSQLAWALQNYGLALGLSHYVSLSYLGMERILRASGCCFERLGDPREIDGRLSVALKLDISGRIRDLCGARIANSRDLDFIGS